MVDVEEAQLLPPLFGDDEHSVQEVQDLRQVKHVQDEADRRVRVVERIARQECVSSSISTHTSLDAHV